MRRVQWISFLGRFIKLFTRIRQSVNICTTSNRDGVYERRFFLRPGFHITAADLYRFANLQQLIRWLEQRSYRQLV